MSFIVGSTDEFNALLYPDQHQSVRGYMQEHLSSFTNAVTDIGQNFVSRVKNLYERLNDSSIMERARAVVRAASGIMNYNVIYQINNLEDLRAASTVMQRWLMANPTVREVYLDQRCDGYSETYFNIHDKDIGEDHYDYRRVMHGSLVKENNEYVFKHYYDSPITDDEKPLTVEEQFIIQDAWDIANLYFANKQDCTNPFGGDL